MSMNALGYECFVRDAFKVKRSGDPAQLANADYYNGKSNFNKVKVATAYSIEIYNRRISEERVVKDPDDYKLMDKFLERALNASGINDINSIINDYKDFIQRSDTLPRR